MTFTAERNPVSYILTGYNLLYLDYCTKVKRPTFLSFWRDVIYHTKQHQFPAACGENYH